MTVSERINTKLTEALQERLGACAGIGSQIAWYDEVASTNDIILEENFQTGAIVLSEHQTRGRGRGENTWWSVPGQGILMSVLIEPAGAVHLYTGMGALAAACAAERLTGISPDMKWPNDLLLNKRKFCGVLAEQRTIDTVSRLVLGIGINVNNAINELPPDSASLATSLKESVEGQDDVNRIEAAAILIKELQWLDQTVREDAGEALCAAWYERLDLQDCPVVLTKAEDEVRGYICGLNRDGTFAVQTEQGVIAQHYDQMIVLEKT